MALRPRTLDDVLRRHVEKYRQMAFVAGPRQVGKTTTCRNLAPGATYLDWDDQDDRRIIVRGPAAVVESLGPPRLGKETQLLVFDELHKYARWTTFLKGLFDKHGARLRIVVTGSSRLDLYRRGGDSLMGRYFSYRMHPLGVGELVRPVRSGKLTEAPAPLGDPDFRALWTHGGFPEPFVQRKAAFSRRWQRLRVAQLVREDVRDLTPLQQLGQLEVLATLLGSRSGQQISYSNLARELGVSVDTIRRWVALLCTLHHGFLLRPWFRNVAKSLRKEPKWYLQDWSTVTDPGARAETLVACHLRKAVDLWNDLGLGAFELGYLRDKQKREVDFVVVRDERPWFLVEVKSSDGPLSPSLAYFQKQTGAAHALQVVLDAPFVDADCFRRREPCVVPARTLLSQLP